MLDNTIQKTIDVIQTLTDKLSGLSYKAKQNSLLSSQYQQLDNKLNDLMGLLGIEQLGPEYNNLVAIGFSGNIYGDAQYMNSAAASGLNGEWIRITDTDQATIQQNGYKSEKWQHQSGNYILKFGESQWEIYDKAQTYRAACEAGVMQTLSYPWEDNTNVMWVGAVMIPISGKFYLKSETQEQGFGAKYLISGSDIDQVNGYYYLDETDYGYSNEPVYKNKNGYKISYIDEAAIYQLIIYTGQLFNNQWTYVGPHTVIYKWNQIGGVSDISQQKWTRNDAGTYILESDMICQAL